jgi:hypothetical protein
MPGAAEGLLLAVAGRAGYGPNTGKLRFGRPEAKAEATGANAEHPYLPHKSPGKQEGSIRIESLCK